MGKNLIINGVEYPDVSEIQVPTVDNKASYLDADNIAKLLAINPDWTQGDPNKIDFIKNRTHFTGAIGADFNGEIDEDSILVMSDNGAERWMVRVADALTYEELLGSNVIVKIANTKNNYTLTDDKLEVISVGGRVMDIKDSDNRIVSVLQDERKLINGQIITIPAGLYFYTNLLNGEAITYTVNIEITRRLEDKYIPNTIARLAEVESKITELYNLCLEMFKQKPVTIYETDGTTGLVAIQGNAGESWQLTDLDLSPFKRLKIYITSSGSSNAATTPALVTEMTLDNRALSKTLGVYVVSSVAQNPNNANRLYAVTFSVNAEKTAFTWNRSDSIYGTAATDAYKNDRYIWKIEGYYD